MAAGLPKIRIPDTRHTCAALLISRGAPAKMIQEQLGHADISTTMNVYGHLFPDDLDALADALDDTYRNATGTKTPPRRPPEVVPITARKRKQAL